MKRISSLGVAFVVVTLFASQARAQAIPGAKVNWDAGQPAVAAGQVSATGTYALVNPNPNMWAPTGAVLTVLPTAGGITISDTAAAAPAGGKWGGAAAPLIIKGLPTGQYTVYVTINLKGAGGVTMDVTTATAIVNVP